MRRAGSAIHRVPGAQRVATSLHCLILAEREVSRDGASCANKPSEELPPPHRRPSTGSKRSSRTKRQSPAPRGVSPRVASPVGVLPSWTTLSGPRGAHGGLLAHRIASHQGGHYPHQPLSRLHLKSREGDPGRAGECARVHFTTSRHDVAAHHRTAGLFANNQAITL
jgi:hypothetical protein